MSRRVCVVRQEDDLVAVVHLQLHAAARVRRVHRLEGVGAPIHLVRRTGHIQCHRVCE